MSLDLIVLTPDAASRYARALSIYQSEDEEGDPASPDLRAFAHELDAATVTTTGRSRVILSFR